jgi:hypothetical protein
MPICNRRDNDANEDTMSQLILLPCLDAEERAARCREVLDIPRARAAELGRTAVQAAETGVYTDAEGQPVPWQSAVARAVAAKRSLPPDAVLPVPSVARNAQTSVQVANETTLATAHRLVDGGERVLALNFANGLHPGGGFLKGARAQEEVLCRSSALYATLRGDPMYAAHAARTMPDSTDWAILSPEVPVFRTDDGATLPATWALSLLTCAAPYTPGIGQPLAAICWPFASGASWRLPGPMTIRPSSWVPGAAVPLATTTPAPRSTSIPRLPESSTASLRRWCLPSPIGRRNGAISRRSATCSPSVMAVRWIIW